MHAHVRVRVRVCAWVRVCVCAPIGSRYIGKPRYIQIGGTLRGHHGIRDHNGNKQLYCLIVLSLSHVTFMFILDFDGMTYAHTRMHTCNNNKI